jgi:hypothetical protein
MVDYERIVKECFWDYDMSVEDLKSIQHSDDKEAKRKLFSKIIYNSKDKLSDLMMFKKEELREFFEEFKPTYNEKYITKHVLVLRSLLLGEKVKIKGLE